MQFQRRRPARNKVIQYKSINNDFCCKKYLFVFNLIALELQNKRCVHMQNVRSTKIDGKNVCRVNMMFLRCETKAVWKITTYNVIASFWKEKYDKK